MGTLRATALSKCISSARTTLSSLIETFNQKAVQANTDRRLTKEYVFSRIKEACISLDGILKANVDLWKIVEEIHFRKKDLERTIEFLEKRESVLLSNRFSQEIGSLQWKKELILLRQAQSLLEDFDTIIPTEILNLLQQMLFLN